MADNDAIRVQVQKRRDGRLTVRVDLVGWDPNVLTSLEQRPMQSSRIIARIALKVYELFGADPSRIE